MAGKAPKADKAKDKDQTRVEKKEMLHAPAKYANMQPQRVRQVRSA